MRDEWGRPGGGWAKQRHPEEAHRQEVTVDNQASQTRTEPTTNCQAHPPQQALPSREGRPGSSRSPALCPPGGGPPERSEGEEGALHWWEPRPPFVTGSAGATFPQPREGEPLCPPRGGPTERTEGEKGEPLWSEPLARQGRPGRASHLPTVTSPRASLWSPPPRSGGGREGGGPNNSTLRRLIAKR